MSKGNRYLEYVNGKLQSALSELDQTILEVQKDIESMNDYYWENYTEMDQYGYENFDNQQALMTQMNANTENMHTRRKLRKMLDSPFFGSVAFVYEGEEEPEEFYIGIGNFAERRGSLPLIYDWRAPVSSLFYDYDKGEASYEAPGGQMDGEILSKWQYKVKKGRMLYEFESDVKIDDEILKQELGANSDVQLKTIVRTIQKEQNAIIRNTKDKILVIQGAAGSGKTSVALHRIAYLLYHDRKHLHASNILILSPNSVFSDYISHILPELGEENIREMSFDLFAYRELKGIVNDCEDRMHQMERQMKRWDKKKEQRYRFKQSKEYIGAVGAFLAWLEEDLVSLESVEYKKFVLTEDELLDLFYHKFADIPILSRMDAVIEYFVDGFETLHGKNFREEEVELIREKFLGMYRTRDIYELYSELLEANGYPGLSKLPPEKRVLLYEDVYPMLYLKYSLLSHPARRKIRHLVIDEMQDYSYLQYVILKELFQCSMTILGDRAQTIDGDKMDALKVLPGIFGKKIRLIEMNKSYRNTQEISDYANEVAGLSGIEYITRHGKEVTFQNVESVQELCSFVEEHVRTGDGQFETAAVLTMTEKEAKEIYEALRERLPEVSYIDRDTSNFKPGLTVTTYYMAKGLEFDQVFIAGRKGYNRYNKAFHYISATRALHELYVMEVQ